MSDSRSLRWLNKAVIYPLIVKPIRDHIDDRYVNLVDRLDQNVQIILNAIDSSRDKRSKYLPLIFVQDVDTNLTLKGEIKLMQLKDTQKCRIEFGKPLDKKGNEAKVQDGSVSISITDDSAHFEVDPSNPFAGTVIADKPTADPTQPGAVVITADADLGDGVNNIQGVEPLIVTAGDAVGFGPASVGTPEEQ